MNPKSHISFRVNRTLPNGSDAFSACMITFQCVTVNQIHHCDEGEFEVAE